MVMLLKNVIDETCVTESQRRREPYMMLHPLLVVNGSRTGVNLAGARVLSGTSTVGVGDEPEPEKPYVVDADQVLNRRQASGMSRVTG